MKKEDEWLKAVLEGKIKPGEEDWEKIRTGEEFAELRETLYEVGGMRPEDIGAQRAKMWRVVRECRSRGQNRPRSISFLHRVAAVVIPLTIGGVLWFALHRSEPLPLVQQMPQLEGGSSRAVLILEKGQRMNLSEMAGDTILSAGEVRIRLDSARNAVYERTGRPPERVAFNTLVVPRQGEYRLVLDDGSKVYLNAESELRFPVLFAGKQRRVYLKGEAYFEVAADTARPFTVEVEGMEVRVLGTRFNVNAYHPERMIQTTLVSGSVQVSDQLNGTSAVLVPGRQAIWREGQFSVREVDVTAYIAWTEGKFCFEEGATLEVITEQLQRWYDIDFFFTSERLKQLVFAGVIRKDFTANEIFKIIEKTTRVHFRVNGRTVIVSE